jgi:hypothetical protein
MLDHRWVLAAFALGLLLGWFTTWVSTKMLVAHYRSEILYWRGMWRKADKRLTRLILQYIRDPPPETEAEGGEEYVRDQPSEGGEVEEPKDEEPSPEPPVDRATAIERLIRDRDATDQDPPEDRD